MKKKAFLFDLDGTLYLGKNRISGALALIEYLTAESKEIFYFTNNSSRSDLDYQKKLRKMGFPVQREQIVLSTHSLIRCLQQDRVKRVFCLGTPAMKRMLWENKISHGLRPQAVVIGFDKTLNYRKWLEACRWIDRGLPYYVTHPDYFCPTDQGPEPDCGAIALATEKVVRKLPKATLGKPHRLMIQEVKKRCRLTRQDMVLVGDRLHTDIQMAESAGITSVLVLTGETNRAELRRSRLKPDFVFSSVLEIYRALKKRT